MSATGRGILALDTATHTIVVAVGTLAGDVLAYEAFEGRYRHSQELLPAVVRVLERAGLRLGDLDGIVVGTGPGAFTGLRVGIATAKTLAHELGIPIVGVPTSDALLAATEGATEVWLPSGPRDRVVVRAGAAPTVLRGDPQPREGSVDGVAAVDLADRAPEGALALGRRAVEGLPAALHRLGVERLSAGDVDDPQQLVPAYAVAPRGAPDGAAEGGVAWSRDPR